MEHLETEQKRNYKDNPKKSKRGGNNSTQRTRLFIVLLLVVFLLLPITIGVAGSMVQSGIANNPMGPVITPPFDTPTPVPLDNLIVNLPIILVNSP